MIEIKEVKTNKEIKEFCNFPLKLYKNCKYYVPELYDDLYKDIKYNESYKDQVLTKCYLAYLDNKVVGRIQAIIQLVANKKWNQKRVRFTRFDSINNQDVANALFDECVKWAKQYDIEEIVGPLGYSDLEREGMLIEGFDQLSTFEESYNYDYYPALVENYGFEKDVDWVERKLKNFKPVDTRYERISKLLLKKYNLHFVFEKNTKTFIDKHGQEMFDIIDETYKNIYGTVPMTQKVIDKTLEGLKLLLNKKYLGLIQDENNRTVAFGVCCPSIAESVRDCKGKLFPFGFIKVLKEIKHPKVIDLMLVGVLDEYKNKGISSSIFAHLMSMLEDPNIDHAETNLNLEDNLAIINQWKAFDNVLHKRRRAYKKSI